MADLEAMRDARELIARAHETLRQIRVRVPGLASAMRWRSRAAEEFGEALAEWAELLQQLDGEIERWDAVLARRQAQLIAAGPAP